MLLLHKIRMQTVKYNTVLLTLIILWSISICQYLAFATDKIAFATDRDGNWEIYLMNVDGTDCVNLTRHPASDFYPAWSPDGKRIAFFSNRDGNLEIYLMRFFLPREAYADGSSPERLTNNEAKDKAPAWSSDGKKIAFSSDRRGNFDIFVMNADGSEPIQLTYDLADDILPEWSLDNSKIAFTSKRDEDYEIYVLDVHDRSETRLTYSFKQDCYPSWSPDGKRIAFTSMRDGDLEIYLMDYKGENLIQLTNNNVDDAIPRWSPDGNKIAYQYESSTGNWVLALMDADGKNKELLVPGTSWDTEPAWAPVNYSLVSVWLSGNRPTTLGEIKAGQPESQPEEAEGFSVRKSTRYLQFK